MWLYPVTLTSTLENWIRRNLIFCDRREITSQSVRSANDGSLGFSTPQGDVAIWQ